MPLTRPTIRDLVSTGESEINALIPGADARLPFSKLGIMARVWALLAEGLYSTLEYLSRQLFARTAQGQYLTDLADSYGVERLEARAAVGNIRLTGVGAIVDAGTVFQTGQGIQYTTSLDAIVPAAGYVDVPGIAVQAGREGNAAAAVRLAPASPVYLLSAQEIAPGGFTGGAPEETDDELRERLLFRRRNPPGPGTVADWERWTREFSADVERVWVVPVANGNGTVGVIFDTTAGSPSAPLITAMRAHLEQYLPAGCQLSVYAPTYVSINFTIAAVPAANASVQQAIIAELTDLLYRESGPGKTIPLSHFREAISAAQGETDHTMTVPSAPVVFTSVAPVFQVGQMGAVTWT
jgi:uncharacterized phage protein gp47/JayE